jgi:tetratricopeptide (TPR) repeat protein
MLAAPHLAALDAPVALAPEAKEAADQELRKIMEADGEALAEVDGWIRDNQAFAAKGAGAPAAELNNRIRSRLAPVRQAYEEFLRRHPDHVRARLAYAAFLDDLGEETLAQAQIEKALALDPTNPAVYNNLALIYAQNGPTTKALECFGKAIELAPREARYYGNLAKTVSLFRHEAAGYFGLTESQVLEKVVTLYSNAVRLDPQNFLLASDLAQAYYPLGPLRADDALRAWTNALDLASDELQRQGIHVHLARIKIQAGRLAEARAHLDALTNAALAELRASLARQLEQREKPTPTNGPPAAPASPPATPAAAKGP